jgi:signal transduction histidine kinase
MDIEIADMDNQIVYSTVGSGTALSSERFSTGSSVPQYSSMQTSNDSKTYGLRKFEIKRQPISNADFFVYSTSTGTGDSLHVYYSVANVRNVVETADRIYSLFSIVVVVVLTAVFFIIVSGFIKPVVEINDVTKGMARLNFERKCNDYGEDEIGELGKNINILSDTLSETLEDLKDKNGQLEKDIELRLALDNARKSFISNVSHELKTPIAIISGYAEGLYEGINEDPAIIKEYCGIINEESKKMNSLVLELLELSKLESKSAPFEPEMFCIGEDIASLIDHLSLQTERAGIKVINNVSSGLMCYAQRDKIEIVLKNYVTNAIAHCSGEKRIEISSRAFDNSVEISVTNTGENIADEDMGEIWNSFYRADKAHGRSENRFGLGLSIVKSIMENHGCHYGVENTEDGVKFTFEVAKDAAYYAENKT